MTSPLPNWKLHLAPQMSSHFSAAKAGLKHSTLAPALCTHCSSPQSSPCCSSSPMASRICPSHTFHVICPCKPFPSSPDQRRMHCYVSSPPQHCMTMGSLSIAAFFTDYKTPRERFMFALLQLLQSQHPAQCLDTGGVS